MKGPPIPYEVVDGKQMLKRSDLWRLDYRVRRYMSHLHADDLYDRLVDVFSNLTTLTPEGQIGLPPIKGDIPFPWMELWTHLLEEYGLRGTGLPGGFIQDVALPKPTGDSPAKGTRELSQKGLNAAGKLIKYGNQGWLKETYLTGRWRISPASFYQSDDLCRARKDSEMELGIKIPSFKRHPNASDVLNEDRPDTLVAVRSLEVTAPSDYYLSCFARTFIHRLFDDFSSDSCLIVMDEAKFIEKMFKAFAEFRPRWRGLCRRVDYIDPILPTSYPNIFFAKHFRYAYQDEFRFVWLPDPHVPKLAPVFLELGPLTDCCEFLPVSILKAA